MRARKLAITGATVVLSVTTLVACSSSGGGGSNSGKGPITFVTGKDNSGIWPTLSARWNKQHPDEKVTVKQQSDQADQQLSDLEQHFQARDSGYDVVTVDVIWTAEFAAKGWIATLNGKIDTSPLLPATVKAATYAGKLYAAPFASDGGLLYYRKDIVPTPPKTWDELIADCKGKTTNTITGGTPACYAGQFANYEGLTVNAAEAINAAGCQIVKSTARRPMSTRPRRPRAWTSSSMASSRATSPGRPSASRRRRASTRSKRATWCSCATGRTPTPSLAERGRR